MTTFYWVEAFVPCCNRRVIGSCIEHMRSIAAKENKPMCSTIFVTRELLEYEVLIDHGAKKTRIHGDGWHRFLDEYVVQPGDMIYICLPRGNGRFFVDVVRDGVRQKPLPYLASNGLSLMKRELIDNCVYTRSVPRFEYSEMTKMIMCAFGGLEDVCCIFVHKMNGVDIKDGYMDPKESR
nr:uncharacterized protein LOC120974863 [Aegilops tauschii subsp. strangulata]